MTPTTCPTCGQPVHKDDDRRTERIMFRTTPAERDRLQQSADEAGVKLGQYIRSKTLRGEIAR